MSESQEVAPVEEVLAPEAELPESAQAPAEPQEAETEAASTSEEEAQVKEKTFTQAELDEILKKRLAKAENKAERRARSEYERKLAEIATQAQRQPQQTAQPEGKPKLEQYEKVEDYVEAVADWKMQAREQAQRQQSEAQRQTQMAQEINAKVQSLFDRAEDEPGFDSDFFEHHVNIDFPMAYAIMDSDIAPKLMIHLQNNPDEADRIAKLSPARQAAEIGKLEVKLSTPAKVKVSSAPAPVKPVGQRGAGVVKDPQKMSQAELEKWLGYAR